MYYLNNDAFDYFEVSFTNKESVIGGRHYPLGYFAATVLELELSFLHDFEIQLAAARKELEIFFAARTVSSAGIAQEELTKLWRFLYRLPVYHRLLGKDPSIHTLVSRMRSNPEELNAVFVSGTPENEMYQRWISKLEKLPDELRAFVRNTSWMLEEYFEDLPSRKPEAYAKAFAAYRRDIDAAFEYRAENDETDYTLDLDSVQLSYPVNVSFVPVADPKTGAPMLAEQVTFESLVSFLYMDLHKGMAAGNVPRRCHNCHRWFLAIGGYNTVYCERRVPGEDGKKTCRDVGAHKKEKQKNSTEFAEKEYSKVYNRLKARKRRGQITVDEWNRKVALAQELKAGFKKRKIRDKDYVQKLNEL